MLGGAAFGVVWMSSQAVMPAVIGRAIDVGVTTRDERALLTYGGVIVAIGLVQAISGIMRHRFAVTNFLTAAYRVVQLTGRQAVRLGGSLTHKVSTGEVVAIGTNDLSHIGGVMDVTARFSGALVSFVLVAVILLQTSTPLGLLVLIGVPLLMGLIAPLLRPLNTRAARHRHLMGELSNTATDIVGGLRVLRGIGGEQVFGDRYRRESQATRRAGVRVARLQSVLDALQVFLPGVFVVVVVWAGARTAVTGSLSPGELVAFYGYAAFLVLPLRTATEFANKYIRASVAAGRVCRVLALDPDHHEPAHPLPSPPPDSELVDLRSGLRIAPGRLTAIVADTPAETLRLADRLGHHVAGANGLDPDMDDGVRLGGTPLSALPYAEVRSRIVVSDTGSRLFAGPLGRGLTCGREAADLTRSLECASAGDILDALPAGLDTPVAERGRTFSGGQRQRLVLARVLAADPEILVLVEPTSAVDAHTEARIAGNLADLRRGRTTVVVTSSPLVLDVADDVAFLRGGRVVATGTHAELMATTPDYRAVVTREQDPAEVAR
jgi:ABC-type multidrug transport system fused ATPase/permease subunit